MEILSPFHYLPIGDSSADVSTLLSTLAKYMGSSEDSPKNLRNPRLRGKQILFPFLETSGFPQELSEYETLRRKVPASAALALPAPAGGAIICYSQLTIKGMAEAVNSAVGRPGRWILTAPVTDIDGIMTLARAIAVNIPPVIAAKTQPANALEIIRAVQRAKDRSEKDKTPIYLQISKVQLGKLLEIPPAQRKELAAASKLIVTGLTSRDLLASAAQEAGINIVQGYGIAESSGLCVIDGKPVAGVHAATIGDRIWLSGICMMAGYLGNPGEVDSVSRGRRRWLRTKDAGHMRGPRLVVDGRGRDVIATAGVRIQASLVERVIRDLPQVEQVVVVGVPDPKWGSLVSAVIKPAPDVAEQLLNPRHNLGVKAEDKPQFPQVEPVKVDSERVRELAGLSADSDDEGSKLTPLEAAMAAMAAKIRGAKVDVVAAAETGELPAGIYEVARGTANPTEEGGIVFPAVENPAAEPVCLPEDLDGDLEQMEIAATEMLGRGKRPTGGDRPHSATVPTEDESEPATDLAMLVRSLVTGQLDRAHAPRALVLVDKIPTDLQGNLDRAACRDLASRRIAAGEAWIR
ncbi:AMP-binding enzyme [Varibaculum vaginae]|uniref:AMP-binding enzyme n=1 Tax=Varibaculum vaginae TaxID=2364797 RepID=UPI000F0810C7|nr:AMP-binding protein [Varibaculum vaginae]